MNHTSAVEGVQCQQDASVLTPWTQEPREGAELSASTWGCHRRGPWELFLLGRRGRGTAGVRKCCVGLRTAGCRYCCASLAEPNARKHRDLPESGWELQPGKGRWVIPSASPGAGCAHTGVQPEQRPRRLGVSLVRNGHPRATPGRHANGRGRAGQPRTGRELWLLPLPRLVCRSRASPAARGRPGKGRKASPLP